MTLKLELAPPVQSGLSAQAQERGLSLEAYAERVLIELSGASEEESPKRKSLLELFEPLRGLDLDFRRNDSSGRSVDL